MSNLILLPLPLSAEATGMEYEAYAMSRYQIQGFVPARQHLTILEYLGTEKSTCTRSNLHAPQLPSPILSTRIFLKTKVGYLGQL